MKSTFIAIIGLHILCFFGCKKAGGGKEIGPSVINSSIFFLLKKNNQRLPDSILDGLRLSYFNGSAKNYVGDFVRATSDGYALGVMTTRDIGGYSAGANIKNYYLEYPNGSLDTLFVDYRHLSYNEAVNDPCYCYYPLVSVKYNGVTAQLDSSITQQKVYKFNKP